MEAHRCVHLGAAQGSAIVAKVVLNAWILHLAVVKREHKLQRLRKLLA
jgi:hypothetical protein